MEDMDVLTVDDYGAIRRAHRDGMSPSARSRATSITRVTKSDRSWSSPSRPLAPRPGTASHPSSDRFRPSSTRSWSTTRSSAQATAHRRAGVPSSPRRARLPRWLRPSATLPAQAPTPRSRNIHPAGASSRQRLEADFGHIHVDFPDGRRLVPFLVTTWAYSNGPFVLALPFERTEAILEGMVAAFEFFGGVPKEVWWDNPKTVATLDPPRTPTPDPSPIRRAGQPLRLRPLSSACRLGATRSPTPRAPSRPCNAASRPRSRAWPTLMS